MVIVTLLGTIRWLAGHEGKEEEGGRQRRSAKRI
jgi:hypothetical protein